MTSPFAPLTVALVEDFKIFRQVLGRICEQDLHCRIVGETGSGSSAIELILRHRPHLVLLDLVLEDDIDGFAVAERVRHEQPELRILAFSSHLDPCTIHRVERCRLHGFVDKLSSSFADISEAIRRVSAGEVYFSPRFQAARRDHQGAARRWFHILSETEQTVLSLIGRGWSDEEIAARLCISAATAQGHRSRIMRKLDISGTPKLVAFAIENGFALARSN